MYFISGLGADRRIFEHIRLPEEIRVRYIDWIEPLDREPLPDYCRRLAAQIEQDDDVVLAGLSFGGMAAIEINRFLPARLVILLSSVATRHELPFYMPLVRKLGLLRIIPASFMKWPKFFLYWIFSAETARERTLLRDFADKVTNRYLKWSLDAVLHWRNEQRPQNLKHIHGAADRIFPCSHTHADVCISGAGHLMVHNHAEEVSNVIMKWIKELNIEQRTGN